VSCPVSEMRAHDHATKLITSATELAINHQRTSHHTRPGASDVVGEGELVPTVVTDADGIH